ncbi:MAG: ABC transporter permease [Chloroflexota bacterium]
MKLTLRLERRLTPSRALGFLIPVFSIVLALCFGAVLLAAVGKNPGVVYQKMFSGAFGSKFGLTETVVKAIPLMLSGLGVAVAFRMLLWNIGAEGQLQIGAFAAAGVALAFPQAPAAVIIPAMMLAGFLGGALWASIPATLKAKLQVNEIITSLMLNYVAIYWVEYLVYGPWKNPKGYGFPGTAPFSPAAELPRLGASRVHLGLLFGLVAALCLYFILRRTKWGYEIRVIGENPTAARYAGISLTRNILTVMALSGGLAGLAGMSEVSGIIHALQRGISPGYGYTAIIVAWLAKLNPWAIVVVSFLFAGLLVGGDQLQISMGLPAAMSNILQGAVLFFILGGEILVRHRISLTWEK